MSTSPSGLFNNINNAIAQAGSAGSTALGLAQALRAAAGQQQIRQQAQARQSQLDQQRAEEEEFRNTMQIREHGGTEMPEFNEQQTPEGLIQRTPNPDFAAAQQEGHIVRMPTANGKSKTFHLPDEVESGKSVQLTKDLADKYNEILGTTNFKEGSQIPGSLHNEFIKTASALEEKALHEGNAITVDQAMSDRAKSAGINLPVGSHLHGRDALDAIEAATKLRDYVEPKEPKDPTKKALQFRQSTNDAGDVTTNVFDPETGDIVKTHVQKGVGAKRKDPDAEAKPKKATPGQLSAVERDKKSALDKAKNEWKKAVAEAITPEEKQTANEALRESQRQAQLSYESRISELTGSDPGHNDWAEREQSPAARPSQATAAPQQPQQAKSATMQHVREYAKTKGISEAAAIREAKQRGYVIGK